MCSLSLSKIWSYCISHHKTPTAHTHSHIFHQVTTKQLFCHVMCCPLQASVSLMSNVLHHYSNLTTTLWRRKWHATHTRQAGYLKDNFSCTFCIGAVWWHNLSILKHHIGIDLIKIIHLSPLAAARRSESLKVINAHSRELEQVESLL